MSDNAIIGDQTGVELPQTPVDEEAIIELRKKARFSKSKEFKELREAMEARIEFYQNFLPSGELVAIASKEKAQDNWRLANIVIAELKAVLSAYDDSVELLKDLDNE